MKTVDDLHTTRIVRERAFIAIDPTKGSLGVTVICATPKKIFHACSVFKTTIGRISCHA